MVSQSFVGRMVYVIPGMSSMSETSARHNVKNILGGSLEVYRLSGKSPGEIGRVV
jgi:hypothetical protein